jgi:signal transduction histidine kinase
LKDDISTLIGELTQVRLQELDAIVAMAQEEWAQLINRDCTLFKNLAIETERRRIADDINHFVVPHLGNVMLLADRSADDSIRGQVMLRMQVTITGVNRVIADSHPRLLEETGFIGSVRSLIDRFRRASLIQTVLISPLPKNELDELSLDVKFAIYRVIQEALNNIEKHSAASRALVAVKPCNERLVICIEDNGKGFRETRSTLSRGLRNIRERASAIGATVTWDQARSFPTGTLVTIDLRCDEIARHGKTEAQS